MNILYEWTDAMVLHPSEQDRALAVARCLIVAPLRDHRQQMQLKVLQMWIGVEKQRTKCAALDKHCLAAAAAAVSQLHVLV